MERMRRHAENPRYSFGTGKVGPLGGFASAVALAVVAILVFGGLWGFWGVFFAIPLATLLQAVINAWPSIQTKV